MSIILENLFDIPFPPVELVLSFILADLQHRAGRMRVERVLKLLEQLGDVREASGVDVIVLVHRQIISWIAGVNDVDEGERVIGLKFKYANVRIRGGRDVESVRILGALHNTVGVIVRSRSSDLASALVANTQIASWQDKVEDPTGANLGLVVVGESKAIGTKRSWTVWCTNSFARIRANVPHPSFTQRGLKKFEGRVRAYGLCIDDGLGDWVNGWAVVVEEDTKRRFELGRFGRDFVDRHTVQVERISIRGRLDLGDARSNRTGTFSIENGYVIVVGSTRDIEVINGGCPSKTSLDVGASEVHQSRGTMEPHIFAGFKFRNLGAGMRSVVEFTTQTEDIVSFGSGTGEELVAQSG